MTDGKSIIRIFSPALIIILLVAGCSSNRSQTPVKQTPAVVVESNVGKDPVKQPAENKNQNLTSAQTSSSGAELQSEALSMEGESQENGSLTEEVYALYQEAQVALEKGELDQALASLDKAYAALLKIEASPGSPLDQEKNDLRILLVQKIQQVYAFRLTPPGINHKTIPLIENNWVLSEIKSFQTVEKRFFEESYARSGLFRPMIVEELKKAGLPEELSWLPLIESGFKPRALSRARALGLWQFIASTGYRYGLKRDKYIDERMDPVKSTRAAIKYLSELHDFFGDWTTAIASYNCGEIRVQSVIRNQKIDYLDNFWDLFSNLPYETARYVPRFIATVLIVENPEEYGFNLPAVYSPLSFETVSLTKPVKLSVLASKLGLQTDLLSQLNPELRYDSTPNYPYELRVPAGYGEQTMACLNDLPNWIPPDVVYGWHTVKKGETLGLIARRYRTSVDAIVRLNNLKNSRLIYPGQRLRIPGQGNDLASADETGQAATSSTQASSQTSQRGSGQDVNYVVKPGDTLYEIARTYGLSVDKIKKDNNLESDLLSVGQKLTIRFN
ncbi:MAG TPA: LysM peptidoglycan-binding domain-containing protein [Candidatus Saccharicenans sp.]|jgi:membrane-bound lytic murein transglycosylase D|nr:LysM peptidoglycan-binding domain-containing protein [Candidatus Saccharicenans sp.]HRD02216.1 LysM peptidoglycan-binding domain-containing protein [Candidatus Saccharicenans sp.]